MESSVEAIVLAGGKGTRLAPLTEDTPKPLLKVLGKSVLENVYDKLSQCGIKTAHVTTMYLPWQIEALGAHHGDLEIRYVREKNPLGTAGAVKNAYNGESNTVVVLSGDGVYDFDLKKAIDYHFEKNADVTIVTYKTENPLEYGVVLYDSDGRIQRFAEKPPWSQVISGTVNTGIYIINKNILERIPDNVEYDFGKQLFPLLLAGKSAMFAYEAEGIWYDIGNLDEYFAANCAALDGRIKGIYNNGLSPEELEKKNIEAESPVYVSKSAIIGENVKLGAYTVIGDEAVISDGCDVSCTVIGDGVIVGKGCGIYGSIIGRNVKIGENCVCSEGCAIGACTEVADGAILPKFSFIHSASRISGTDILSKRSGKRDISLFSEEGLKIDKRRINPEYALRIGLCAASASSAYFKRKNINIGIMSDTDLNSFRIKDLILNGIGAAGTRSCDLGTGFESVARYAALKLLTDIVLYVYKDVSGEICVKMFDNLGLEVPSDFEREFSNRFFSAGDYAEPEKYYEPERFDGAWMMYFSDIVKTCRSVLKKETLKDFAFRLKNSGSNLMKCSAVYTLISAAKELGASILQPVNISNIFTDEDNTSDYIKNKTIVEVEISDSGLDVNCHIGEINADGYHMGAVLIEKMMGQEQKERLYISSSSPAAYKAVANARKIECYEYAESTHNAFDISSEEMYKQIWLSDGIFKALCFISVLKAEKTHPEAMVSNLPDFEIQFRHFEGNPNRAGVMHRLAEISLGTTDASDKKREGVRLVMSNGSVTVIPGKISGFKIMSEAKSIEAAKELCDIAEEYLK